MNTTAARKSPVGIILLLFAVVLLPLLGFLALLASGGLVHFSFNPGHFGRQPQGFGYFLALYHSEDDKAYEQTRADFTDWIAARGFTPCQSPGCMTEWAGDHSPGNAQQWYQMPLGANRLMLRITTNHENAREITADTSDYGYYTPAELADTRRREIKIWNEMIDWFETNSKANMLLERPDMKDWYAKGRVDISAAYTKQNNGGH